MSILVARFQGSDSDIWDTFVANSRNGTVFHTRQFLQYHPSGRFDDHSLLFYKGTMLLSVMPAATSCIGERVSVSSHPGASYGGFVLSPACGVKDMGMIFESFISYAKTQMWDRALFLRLTPSSLRRQYSDDQEYWLFRMGATVTRMEMDGSIALRGLQERDLLSSVHGKCRNMIRQAQRSGLTVRFSDDWASFWHLLDATLAARHGAHPTHTLAEILVLQSFLSHKLRLLAAFDGERMIGGIVLITLHPQALYTLYMAQDYAYHHCHPMHLLLFEAMNICLREARDVLHVGVSTEDGGTKVNEGLFFFKESFGMKPVRRETWELVFS